MKIFKKFSIIDMKSVLAVVAACILLLSVISCAVFFVSENLNSHLVGFIVSTGTKTTFPMPDVNIAETMLNLTVPSVRFIEPSPSVKPTQAEEPTETPTNPPVPENDALSITYESAEEKGYKSTQGIYINNQTKKSIDIDALLNKNLDLTLSDEPSVLIVHTHTTESYTPSEEYNYTPTETDRTTDTDFNMASVGEVIYNYLTENGINVIHDKTINDYPSYSTSYSKSLKLVESYTKKYPSIKIVIDVHRDAIVTKEGKKMRPVTAFDPVSSQVMLVVGTNDSGLNHPDWQNNLSFALKLQHKMNSLYPTLARPINLRRERFNQHTAPYAFILEVGTNGNTLDEAKEGALLFGKSLVALLKN